MARTKLTTRKLAIVMPTRRMWFMLGKRVPPHLVKALRNEVEELLEEPQEVQPVEVPIEEPLEDEFEGEPMDEEAEEEPEEEPQELEDSDEEPMEEDEQEEEQGVQKELVTLMMEMTLTTPTLMVMMTALMEVMVVMVVMEVMVVTVDMVEMMMMTAVPLSLLRGGQWSSTMTCKVMTTTIQSLFPLYAATTPGAPCSIGRSIGHTPATQDSVILRCTFVKGVGCATSTVPSQPGSHVQLPFEMLPGRHWWSIVTATSTTSNGKRIAIFLAVGAASLPATSPLHLGRRTSGSSLPWSAWPRSTPTCTRPWTS
jgi:hypothetical protein